MISVAFSLTTCTEINGPVFAVTLNVLMPDPPRRWSRYWAMAVFLPNPSSATERISSFFASFGRIFIPTISSPFLRRIARTPCAARPMGRGLFSLIRVAFRSFVGKRGFTPCSNFTTRHFFYYALLCLQHNKVRVHAFCFFRKRQNGRYVLVGS